MIKKLRLNDLKVKSFITIQSDYDLQTIKAGAVGSDGPPHTSTPGSGHLPCSAQCESAYCSGVPCDETVSNCGTSGNSPVHTNICDSGVGGTFNVTR